MIENIHNVMTDRCVVNQAAVRLINNQWIKKLNHVYCHLHPLDTIATEVKKCLRRLEEDTDARQLSKSGCVIEQIMNAFDKLRYADNIGDPRGFKIHLLKNGLKRGVLQSIRGNRLHLFFQQCEVPYIIGTRQFLINISIQTAPKTLIICIGYSMIITCPWPVISYKLWGSSVNWSPAHGCVGSIEMLRSHSHV